MGPTTWAEARRRLRDLAEVVRPAPPGRRRGLLVDFALGFWGVCLVAGALAELPLLVAEAVWEGLTAPEGRP